MRIYMGGLGSSVQEEDVKKTFTSLQLGSVHSVEIIRSKGRSFGYLEYAPASDKGLTKLFSTYNGCMWKGGRLKLERAREDYLSRLRREWTEDADLKIKSDNGNENDRVHEVVQNPKTDQDISKLRLNIFFPKLRKIKPIPLKGTGKHKYSFKRVEVPPLPVHFCDCEEHCEPPQLAKRYPIKYREMENTADKHEMDAYGVNENEVNMMKSILGKLLEGEDTSKSVRNEAEPTEEMREAIDSADTSLVDDDYEQEQTSDEDNIIINIVGQPVKKRVASKSIHNEAEPKEKIKEDMVSTVNLPVGDDDGEEQASDEDSIVINIVGEPIKKRAASFEDWGQKTTTANQDSPPRELESSRRPTSPQHKSNKENPLPGNKRKHPICDNRPEDIPPSKKKAHKRAPHGSIDDRVSMNAQPTHTKSASINKESTAFCISDILPYAYPNPDSEPGSDPPHSNENVEPGDQSNRDNNLSKLTDAQSANQYARGPFWLKQSSWLQLVADTSKSTFNISQILPGMNFVEHGVQKFGDTKVVDISPRNHNVEVSTQEPNRAGLEGEKMDVESKSIVEEEKDEASGSARVTNNQLQRARAVPEIITSETCPFMKSAASMREWAKTKAALSRSLKKDAKGKERARG